MRQKMLSRQDLAAAVFIGGMDGIEAEYDLFVRFHPEAKVLPIAAPGGAALVLAKRLGTLDASKLCDVDFPRLFRSHLCDSSNLRPSKRKKFTKR